MTMSSLPARMLSGSFWSIFAEVWAGGVRALSYFFYAKFLTPTDFGMVGFCLLLISLFPLLIDNSLALALIRREREDQHAFSVIFFLNVGLSLIAIAVLCLGAPWAADLLHDRRVTLILPVLSVQLLCNALCGAHIAIARRRFRYRALVPVRLLSTFCSVAVGLPLAFLGYSYWALVAGSLTAALSQMIAAWALLRWRPSLEFDWATAKSLSGFISWVAVDMGVTWMMMSGGGIILAYFLGAHDLGLFRLSDQINAYFLGAILSPLIPVFYSAFCEAASDREKWQALLSRTIQMVALLAMTLAGIIVLWAHPLELIIGEKWRGVGAIIMVNAVADGLAYASLPIPTLLRAQGHARAVAALRIAMVVGQVVVYSLVAPHGLQAFVVGKLGLEIAMYVIEYAVLHVIVRMPVLPLVGRQFSPTLGTAVGVLLGLWCSSQVASLGIPTAPAIGLAVFGSFMGGYLFFTDRQFIPRLFRTLRARESAADVDDVGF
jgi:O-antigen/teichoic acid export membrane protein